jgi:hypothetical protein
MMPPLLVTEIDSDEELPLDKVKVPPESTGLALFPKLVRETDEPEPTVVVAGGLDVTVMLTVAVAAAAAKVLSADLFTVIVTLPADTPVTTPASLTVANELLELL